MPLPGWTYKCGRAALAAVSGASASMYRQHVQSAPGDLGDLCFSWWVHDLVADFRLAFGEEPRALNPIAVMTDSDNTRSRAASCCGPVELH